MNFKIRIRYEGPLILHEALLNYMVSKLHLLPGVSSSNGQLSLYIATAFLNCKYFSDVLDSEINRCYIVYSSSRW